MKVARSPEYSLMKVAEQQKRTLIKVAEYGNLRGKRRCLGV